MPVRQRYRIPGAVRPRRAGPCTIARFRAEYQDAFAAQFTQVLQVAGAAGLARFGTAAIDGTKIPANASIDANRGQQWLEEQVRQILAEAQGLDADRRRGVRGRLERRGRGEGAGAVAGSQPSG